MTSQRRTSKNFKTSIKYWWVPLEVQSLEPNHIVLNESLCAPSSHPKCDLSTERKSSKGLTVCHFRSAAAGIWDCVGQPAVFQSKTSFKFDNLSEEDNILVQFDNEKDVRGICADVKIFNKVAECRSQHPSTAKSDFEDLRRVKKMLFFASCNKNISGYFQNSSFSSETNGADKVVSIEASDVAKETTGSISKLFFGLNSLAKFSKNECQAMKERCDFIKGIPPATLLETCSKEVVGKAEVTDFFIESEHSSNYDQNQTSSLHLPQALETKTCTNMESACSNLESKECEKSEITTSVVSKCTVESSSIDYQSTSEKDKFFGTLSLLESFSSKPWLVMQNNLQHSFSNNRHAIAGALAGTLVTLCLHPVDTVKTIIQANGTGQKSFYHIMRRIISQQGILGLYRGIASNIASSAPISAIYTFTYESVKCTLLPLLPKEYHSFAHCVAGGCSSIATSFIFTPSERIKQQMQVSSHYQNCWNALIECLQRGGIPSLYAGWGAVLCRNIPHSIIKFYTYERLQEFFSSVYPDSNLKTFQTLVCGGLAGSTAALFTTPFDVVKTRLQTQVPGSIGKYHGVLHALQEIAREEGFQGLYRGLTPRLAMYVSQGAIFFASYEFLKAVFLVKTASENIAELAELEICPDGTGAAGLPELAVQ